MLTFSSFNYYFFFLFIYKPKIFYNGEKRTDIGKLKSNIHLHPPLAGFENSRLFGQKGSGPVKGGASIFQLAGVH
jgi:hypothetical protein